MRKCSHCRAPNLTDKDFYGKDTYCKSCRAKTTHKSQQKVKYNKLEEFIKSYGGKSELKTFHGLLEEIDKLESDLRMASIKISVLEHRIDKTISGLEELL